VQHQVRLSGAEVAKEETGRWISTINQLEFAFDEPSGPRRFVITQDARRGDFFELLFQVAGKFGGSQRLADRHFAFGRSLMAGEDRVVDAEGTNIDRFRAIRADAAIGRHVNAL